MKDPEQEFDEELQFHIDQRIRDYIARGMTPEAARAAATQRLGDVTRVRQACTSALAAERAAEGRRTMLKVSWLDVKLGLRMSAKHPGAFAERLGGGNVVGRRIRPLIPSRDGAVEPGLWHEIVGVVPSFAERIAPPVGAAD